MGLRPFSSREWWLSQHLCKMNTHKKKQRKGRQNLFRLSRPTSRARCFIDARAMEDERKEFWARKEWVTGREEQEIKGHK